MPWTPEHIPALTLAYMHTLSDATVALVALSPLQMVTDGTQECEEMTTRLL